MTYGGRLKSYTQTVLTRFQCTPFHYKSYQKFYLVGSFQFSTMLSGRKLLNFMKINSVFQPAVEDDTKPSGSHHV